MKKLLLIIALLTFSVVRSQTTADIIKERVRLSEAKEKAAKDAQSKQDAIFNHPNADFIMSLEKMNLDQVKSFSDKIANSGKTKWELSNVLEDELRGYCGVVYVDQSKPKEYKDDIQKRKIRCDDCLVVNYLLYFDGENKDLEIKGIKQYRFNSVSGKYLDLFPTWQSVFKPNATLETTIEDYNLQELSQRTIGVSYWFRKTATIWTISNHSNYTKSK